MIPPHHPNEVRLVRIERDSSVEPPDFALVLDSGHRVEIDGNALYSYALTRRRVLAATGRLMILEAPWEHVLRTGLVDARIAGDAASKKRIDTV